MNVTLRREANCHVDVQQVSIKTMDLEELDTAIRQLQTARKWLLDEQRRKKQGNRQAVEK